MVINIPNQLSRGLGFEVQGEDEYILERLERWEYVYLERAIKSNSLQPASKEKYLLIKLPSEKIPQAAFIAFYELQLLGYVPIIMNAEKNASFKHNPTIIRNFVQRGALIQVNASSLVGNDRKELRKFVLKLCKKNLVHFISSDTYQMRESPSLLKDAYQYLEKKVSLKYVQFLRRNITHVIDGTDFHLTE